MLRCAILDDYQGVAFDYGDFAALKDRVDFTVFRDNIADTPRLIERLQPFDIIVAMRERTAFDAARLAALPNLKLLVTTGMRNASIDLAAAKARGLTVCGTPGFVGSTAELAWGLLIALMRNLPSEMAAFRAGAAQWQHSVGRDLNGLTLAVLGLGNLGAKIATFGRAFNMDVHGWSRNNTPERSASHGVMFAPDLDAVLAIADVVAINLVLTPETRGLINARRLKLMKRGAVLMNTSRGPIVEEAALIAALESGQLGGAALDVYEPEPLPANHPFRRMANVVATPHLGYVTENTYRAFLGGAAEDVAAWLNGSPIRILA